MSDADRTTFLTELADADNATASFISNGVLPLCCGTGGRAQRQLPC